MNAILRDRDLQRVDGAARIAVHGAGGRNAITDLFQRSPCKVLLPDIDGHPCREAVFLNTAGGIAGGDRLSFGLSASGDASFTGTTQASERIYRAIDAPGQIEMRIEAADNAALQWLPQETILFDGGRLNRSTRNPRERHRAPHRHGLAAPGPRRIRRDRSPRRVPRRLARLSRRPPHLGRRVPADRRHRDPRPSPVAARRAYRHRHHPLRCLERARQS